jgi:KTSC domain
MRIDQRLQLSAQRRKARQGEQIPLIAVLRTMPFVQSAALEQVSYDEDAHTLCATFRETHRTYIYQEVPQEIYDGLLFADSLGAYFNAHIRGHFPYREI